MSQWIWLNGKVMPMSEARIGVEDRGFQFADGVYEVFQLYNGQCFAMDRHLDRLKNSAGAIEMQMPIGAEELADQIEKLAAKCDVRQGMVYLQLTRGAAGEGGRDHIFPQKTQPTLLFYARPLPPPNKPGEGEGVKLLPVADERWDRCWIKSIALLPNVLAKNQAVAAGADEAAFVDHGIVSECSTSNLMAVLGGRLVTHPVGPRVLPGITRSVLLECAQELNVEVEERPLREEELIRAEELFISSTIREVAWVARWGERYIGQGRCGPLTRRLHEAYCGRVRQQTGA